MSCTARRRRARAVRRRRSHHRAAAGPASRRGSGTCRLPNLIGIENAKRSAPESPGRFAVERDGPERRKVGVDARCDRPDDRRRMARRDRALPQQFLGRRRRSSAGVPRPATPVPLGPRKPGHCGTPRALKPSVAMQAATHAHKSSRPSGPVRSSCRVERDSSSGRTVRSRGSPARDASIRRRSFRLSTAADSGPGTIDWPTAAIVDPSVYVGICHVRTLPGGIFECRRRRDQMVRPSTLPGPLRCSLRDRQAGGTFRRCRNHGTDARPCSTCTRHHDGCRRHGPPDVRLRSPLHGTSVAAISPRSALTSQTRARRLQLRHGDRPLADGAVVDQPAARDARQQAAGPRRRPALAADLDDDVGDGGLGDLAARVPQDHVVDVGPRRLRPRVDVAPRGLVAQERIARVDRRRAPARRGGSARTARTAGPRPRRGRRAAAGCGRGSGRTASAPARTAARPRPDPTGKPK